MVAPGRKPSPRHNTDRGHGRRTALRGHQPVQDRLAFFGTKPPAENTAGEASDAFSRVRATAPFTPESEQKTRNPKRDGSRRTPSGGLGHSSIGPHDIL